MRIIAQEPREMRAMHQALMPMDLKCYEWPLKTHQFHFKGGSLNEQGAGLMQSRSSDLVDFLPKE